MNPILPTSIAHPTPTPTQSSYVELYENEFFRKYGTGKAIRITADESGAIDATTGFKSITSYEVNDCITIFLIEKLHHSSLKNEAVIGYHIPVNADKIDIKLMSYIDNNKFYEIYLVGGNKETTQGKNCLLNGIKKEIKEIFNENFIIKNEFLDLNAGTAWMYISINMHLNGTLTICHHNT